MRDSDGPRPCLGSHEPRVGGELGHEGRRQRPSCIPVFYLKNQGFLPDNKEFIGLSRLVIVPCIYSPHTKLSL